MIDLLAILFVIQTAASMGLLVLYTINRRALAASKRELEALQARCKVYENMLAMRPPYKALELGGGLICCGFECGELSEEWPEEISE